ncbi:TetR/AcrR family transcriptional regulator [Streptomyces pactum]|uniref:TetR/AcrR family transcriptional regulator n=1 Tax=Streptomyces pactum TaxID=68249 RepID=A0ABS0NLA8_9ACTN|nr:TetR/AcrR family transcriptional regulator [Streptomyces pactum]MBH5335926.1 TetR/AcrR family transcriptional regulator [Streptomyces pactum]
MTAENETLRSDARRNRARVLDAARSAFAEGGLTVPLGEIARRAGVGAGTVYRHFPSKESLFQAVVEESVRRFAAEARQLARSADPAGAFFGFLTGVVERSCADQALREALGALTEAPYRWRSDALEELGAALEVLLTLAQEAGAVRADADIADIKALLVGALVMERHRSTAGGPGRAVAIVCDGLRRPGRDTDASLPPQRSIVTKPRQSHSPRNGTGSGFRNETRPWTCEVCGGPMRPARTGRPARFCGAACRQKAHRRRVRQDGASSA